MPRRRFSRRGGFRRARGFIRRTVSSMGPIERKAIVLTSFSVPARSAAAFDNPATCGLVVAQETVNEETVSNGTTIAETRPYSKVVAIKGSFTLSGSSGGDIVRWMLVKDVDNEGALTSLADANFHSTDDTPTARELRARTLAKGYFVTTDRTGGRIPLFVKRKTLKRLGNLRENDRLELVVAISSSTASTVITGFGTIYVRTN